MDLITDKYKRVIDYLRISITDRCNLRCIYCMPPGGIRPIEHKSLLSYEEITRLVEVAARLGVRKVRITGGEPLARKNLPFLIESLGRIAGIEDISLTTNGLLLKQLARTLASAGLNRVNVSLDSLYPERYRRITRGGDLHDALDGIAEAEKAGLLPVKINVIPMRGINDDEIEEFSLLTRDTALHVRFIEFMPTGSRDLWSRDRYIATDEIRERVSELGALTPVRARKSGPARYFRFNGAPGVIGFISAITHHFCESCNRLRLTSDGKLRPCLFSETEIDVKPALRSGAPDREIERLLRLAVEIKPERHSIASQHTFDHLKPMSKIGG
ncbi:MAG: GTP 3',8-cyclase MoaA [Nitrospirota bacterium]